MAHTYLLRLVWNSYLDIQGDLAMVNLKCGVH